MLLVFLTQQQVIMRSSPRINKEFGKKISELLDSRGLSLRGAWYKTGFYDIFRWKKIQKKIAKYPK